MDTGKGLNLTPEELYYLGGLLQAKYIDYVYISAMSDIGKHYDFFEADVKGKLGEKGILMEDFSGNMEVSDQVRELLMPVFFGTQEAAVDICFMENGAETGKSGVRFHFHEGRITMVTLEREALVIQPADDAVLQNYIRTLEAAGGEQEAQNLETGKMEREKFQRVIAVKKIILGTMSYVDIYVDYAGCIYQEDEDEGCAVPVKNDEFAMSVYHGIKGGIEDGVS